MCNVYVGCGVGLLWVVPSFASWSAISWPLISTCALICVFLCYVMFGPYDLVGNG